jgi:nucleotide-binding universal stress UspA family protein
MLQKVVVPLDGSELSEGVFPWLRFLAEKLQPDAEIVLIRAFEPPSTVYLLPELAVPTSNAFSDDYLGGAILEYLEEKQEELKPMNVTFHMCVGEPASEILEQSKEADLILLASHGRGGLGRWLMGSVATKVARGSATPTMVIGAKVLEAQHSKISKITKILVPLDGSEASERALSKAVEFAKQLDARLVLYQGVSQVDMQHQFALETNRTGLLYAEEYLKRLAGAIEVVETSVHVAETYGGTGISSYAEDIKADLIVMGSHGRSGLVRWVLGSETEKVLQEAHCPVLVTH